jgi:hypothetical protein
MPPNIARFVAALAMMASAHATSATACFARSGEQRIALLELYTSQGCDSCPPADRWVRELPAGGLGPERVVTLAFHVDYWNYLGWKDLYARPEYSARQQAASHRNRARVVYTPQLLLDGKDYRRPALRQDFAGRVEALNRSTARARIDLRISGEPAGDLSVEGKVIVAGAVDRKTAHPYLALYENNLSSQITAGENRGKRLWHDNVVRELAGPFAIDAGGMAAIHHRFRLGPDWKRTDLRVAAFVQDERSGEVLQALSAGYCG